MRRYLPFLIVSVVALLTVGSGAFLYRANRPRLLTKSDAPATHEGKEVHARGPANAVVTLEEFGDFECPPCGILSAVIHQLEQDFHPRLRVIFRQFPLIMHRHATTAACASEAAGMQGRFWEMHDLLYKEQPVWSKAADAKIMFNAYAGMIGLDVERFQKDMVSGPAVMRVKSDQQEGTKLGVTNTPTIFLNGKQVPAASLNPPKLREAIEELLK
jgi:protein-disulfide isomerase